MSRNTPPWYSIVTASLLFVVVLAHLVGAQDDPAADPASIIGLRAPLHIYAADEVLSLDLPADAAPSTVVWQVWVPAVDDAPGSGRLVVLAEGSGEDAPLTLPAEVLRDQVGEADRVSVQVLFPGSDLPRINQVVTLRDYDGVEVAAAPVRPDAQTRLILDELIALRAEVKALTALTANEHTSEGVASGDGTSGGGVDLNTATAQQLELLPHIGPVRAAAIVAARVEHGPFGSIDELIQVPGIGSATIDKLRPHLTIGGE
ncbi:MAG: helix-hairpin-helix domain-containing protein [Planctomycetota bacterium]